METSHPHLHRFYIFSSTFKKVCSRRINLNRKRYGGLVGSCSFWIYKIPFIVGSQLYKHYLVASGNPTVLVCTCYAVSYFHPLLLYYKNGYKVAHKVTAWWGVLNGKGLSVLIYCFTHEKTLHTLCRNSHDPWEPFPVCWLSEKTQCINASFRLMVKKEWWWQNHRALKVRKDLTKVARRQAGGLRESLIEEGKCIYSLGFGHIEMLKTNISKWSARVRKAWTLKKQILIQRGLGTRCVKGKNG